MEEIPVTGPSVENTGCVSCGSPAVADGYSTRLCNECRDHFIKFPIPFWVKLFAAGVGIVFVFALFTFPKNLSLGIHLEKGKQCEKDRKFLTAQREFTNVLEKVPDQLEANAHLMIAAFYNQDFTTFGKAAGRLADKNMEDEELAARLNELINKADEYFPDSSLDNVFAKYKDAGDAVLDTALHSYIYQRPQNIYGLFIYASVLYKKKAYNTCDSVLNVLLKQDEWYVPALRLRSGVQRDLKQWNEAIQTCDKILYINKEAGYAIATKARACLQQKKDAQGLELALKSMETNKTDPYNMATLVLAYHFNNQSQKRDALIREAKAQKDSTVQEYLQYALDVIQNKEPFRN